MGKRVCAAMGAGLAFIVMIEGQGAFAQSDMAGADEAMQVGDIIVTARKVKESLQSAPVSISAMSGSLLEQVNLHSIDKLAEFVPNVSITASAGGIAGTQPYIRGIGTQETLLTIDSPVGFYIDGVYLGRQSSNNLDLVEPERIEVLRGPQGTLYGRNTTGGAINVVTRTPPSIAGAQVKAGISSFNGRFIRGSADTGEIANSGIAGSFAVLQRQQRGFVNNVNASRDRDPGARTATSLWGKLHGEWDQLTVDIAADWSNIRGQLNPLGLVKAYQPAADYFSRSPDYGGDPFVVSPSFKKDMPFEYVGRQKVKSHGVSVTAAYEFSPAISLKAISAWRGSDAKQPTSYAGKLLGPVVDFTSPDFYSIQRVTPFVAYGLDLRQRQFSQEVQLLGSSGDWNYVAGAYYFNERGAEDGPNHFTLVVPPSALEAMNFPAFVGAALQAQGIDLIGVNLGQRLAYRTQNESLSGYGQVSWKPEALNRQLEVTAGLRYTHDKRNIHQDSIASAGPTTGPLPNPATPKGPSRYGRLSFDNWSYLVSLSYQWTPDMLTYARFSTGYKAGGFDARAGVDLVSGVTYPFTFQPEKAQAYELGLKTDWFDRRLRLNVALFQTDYDSLQVPQYTGGNGFVPNADARYRGFELEAFAVPLRGVQFDTSLGYVDPKYKSFLIQDPITGVLADLSKDGKFAYVPKWTMHIGGQIMHSFDFADAIFRVDYTHTSKRYFHALSLLNPANEILADKGQDLLSARLSLSKLAIGQSGMTAELSVFGENLLGRRTRQAGIDFGPAIGIAGVTYGQGRSFGLNLKIETPK